MLAAGLECRGLIRGLIIEKTSRPGSKLLMSGGGRCNITHGGSIKEFINAYGDDAGLRLRKCLYRHSNTELTGWLEETGVGLADESGQPVYSYDLSEAGRIFPASMRSADVLNAFLRAAKSNGWELRTGKTVCGIEAGEEDAENAWTVLTDDGCSYYSRCAVIATGGITYPETGSDGSMFGILRGSGIGINGPRPALAPINVKDYPYEELSGISIPDVTVTAFASDAAYTCKGKAARMNGDLLFTHRGFSGPVILNISRYAEPEQLIRIKYNKEFNELPRRMRKILEDRSRGSSGDIRTSKLAGLLDADDFTVESVDRRGMVTAGGICLECIDMATMQIKPGLYAVGEAVNADGITGGYNLQMCWSTAMTAADSIREKIY